MISTIVRAFVSALLGCLLALTLAGQSTDTKKTPAKAATTAKPAAPAQAPASQQPRNTAGLVTSAQLTQWMEKNGAPRGTTATIYQWEYAMNKIIPGGWHSYGVNFLNRSEQGKNDTTRYTADQFLQGLKKYEAERNQALTNKK